MVKKKAHDITLDDLAGMIARGFDKTSSDIFEVKTKLSEHDKRFDRLEFRIDEVKDAIERLEEGDVLDLQKRVHVLEKIVRSLVKQTR
jgi:uncharacterized protein YdcH (DUF465 family)